MMRNIRTGLAILFLTMGLTPNSFATNSDKYDPIQTALALNYCQLSITRMVTHNDKVVLDQEYDNIINNINLSKIEDREIMQLFLSLMDSLTESKLVTGDKKWLQKEYEKKVEQAVYESFTEGAALVAGAAGSAVVGDFRSATRNLTQVGMQYFNYQKVLEEHKDKLDRSKWELEKDTIEFLNYQRKKMLSTCWELTHRYNLPDEWRLTEKQINGYVEILKDDQINRRLRKLLRIETEFHAYPPFWYYYGKTAQDSGDRETALRCYDRYERTRKGIFRFDPFYSATCMNRISLLDEEKNKNEIFRNVEIITQQSKDDSNMILFCALTYMKFGQYEKAKKLFQKNIDEEYQVSLNERLMGEAFLGQKSPSDLIKLIDKMIENEDVKNQDILYLIGRARELDLIKKLEKQITDIEFIINTNLLSKEDIIIKLPVKWFFEDLEVTLSFEGQTMKPASIKANKQEKMVYCKFKSVIDEDEFYDNTAPKLFTVGLKHASYPMDIIFQADIIEKSEDSFAGKVSVYKHTPKWAKNKLKDTKLTDKKTVKEIEIKPKEIHTAKKVFPFKNGLLVKK